MTEQQVKDLAAQIEPLRDELQDFFRHEEPFTKGAERVTVRYFGVIGDLAGKDSRGFMFRVFVSFSEKYSCHYFTPKDVTKRLRKRGRLFRVLDTRVSDCTGVAFSPADGWKGRDKPAADFLFDVMVHPLTPDYAPWIVDSGEWLDELGNAFERKIGRALFPSGEAGEPEEEGRGAGTDADSSSD